MANNIQELWGNLVSGKDCITEVPETRWDYKKYEHAVLPTGNYLSKWGGFIDDPDCFDALLFNILLEMLFI
jgi:Polyketide synthase modules and related proteins